MVSIICEKNTNKLNIILFFVLAILVSLYCSCCSLSGELLGIEYLYRQTGTPLLDITREISHMQQEEEEGDADSDPAEEEEGDEGFDETEGMDPTIFLSDLLEPFGQYLSVTCLVSQSVFMYGYPLIYQI